MSVLPRRLRSRVDYLRFVYRAEATWLAAFGLFAMTLPIAWLPEPVVAAAAALGVLASLIGLALSGRDIYREWRRAQLVDVGPGRSNEPSAQWASPAPRSWIVRHAGPDQTGVWWDADVNRTLHDRTTSGARLRARLVDGRYYLPTRLQAVAGRALRFGQVQGRRRRANRTLPIRFNGQLLRLSTEPTVQQLSDGTLEFERVTYFDGECSNEMWGAAEVDASNSSEPRLLIDHYACDHAGAMLALENARVANIVGVSILAVTADEQAILVRQSTGNSIAPGAWSVSGSGSLEQLDLKTLLAESPQPSSSAGEFDGRALVLAGMLREMREESLVGAKETDPDSAVITAYWRWATRAMKPEFSGLVRLRISASELLARRHRGDERAFSVEVRAFPLDELLSLVRDGDPSAELQMSPSCEVTLRAADEFLRSPAGADWAARADS